jgi:hypothetical protein
MTGNEWPFRICGDGVEWFNLRGQAWVFPIGSPDPNGYHMMNWKLPNGKRRFLRLHSVVWETHFGPVPEGLEIDHIDGDKSNNAIGNLRLVTHAQNIQYGIDRLGHWLKDNRKLEPHQLQLLLAIPLGWRCLIPLAERWGMSKYSLGNIRAEAKKNGDSRYLAGL